MTNLIIDDITPRISYVVGGTPQTVFVIPFVFFENSNLVVTVGGVTKALTTDYTATGASSSAGGTLTLGVAVSLTTVVIERVLPIERVTDFPESGPLSIAALNLELDRQTAMIQQVADDITTTPGSIAVSAALIPFLEAASLDNAATILANTGKRIRIKLQGNTTFYVATTGNDSTGDGSSGNPWATCTGAYHKLQSRYDLNGNTVTVNVADGTYTQGCSVSGPIVGQQGAGGLRFIGNLTNPALCVIASPDNYGFGAAFSAKFQIAGFKIDMTNGTQDMISVGQEGEIWIINPNPGSTVNVMIFGTSAGIGLNDMSAAFRGQIFVDTWAGVTVDSTGDAFATTGTWTSGAGTMVVANASGIREGMAVRGTGVHPLSYVASKAGTTLTLNGAGTFASKTAEPVTFTMSRQCHADVGQGGAIIHNTNGGPNLNSITLLGNPHYNACFILANGSGAQASFQSITFTGTCTGMPFCARALGSIDTLASTNDPATYLPGTRMTRVCTFSFQDEHLTLSSNGALPQWGNEINPGNMIVGTGIRSPANPTFLTAASEHTVIEYYIGVVTDVKLSRPASASETSVTLTFVGQIGQGGQYI